MSDQYLYGIHVLEFLLSQQPERIKQLWMADKSNVRVKHLLQLASDIGMTVKTVDLKQLDAWTASGVHQGAVALVAAAKPRNEAWLDKFLENTSKPPLFLVLDGVTDPHNLGACLRSADAAGVDAVILPKDKSAGLSGTVSKVACGAAEVLPVVTVTNLSRTLKTLKQAGVWLVGTAGESTKSIYQAELSGALAIVMGAEGKGMRRLTREQCDFLVNIPMQGMVSSLNVSVATGVCLFEAVRQRQANKS